ncbi:hypothetical protein L9F63_022549 [Diploptera punctata]|uniref:Uncharacterized protein n=1 Tax=Diploptera punctata TaxID=6984 RepID=A0AAD8EAR2_DIPPU|nr:hypothetical protein L9F63_022549 [Diploptera punctata]
MERFKRILILLLAFSHDFGNCDVLEEDFENFINLINSIEDNADTFLEKRVSKTHNLDGVDETHLISDKYKFPSKSVPITQIDYDADGIEHLGLHSNAINNYNLVKEPRIPKLLDLPLSLDMWEDDDFKLSQMKDVLQSIPSRLETFKIQKRSKRSRPKREYERNKYVPPYSKCNTAVSNIKKLSKKTPDRNFILKRRIPQQTIGTTIEKFTSDPKNTKNFLQNQRKYNDLTNMTTDVSIGNIESRGTQNSASLENENKSQNLLRESFNNVDSEFLDQIIASAFINDVFNSSKKNEEYLKTSSKNNSKSVNYNDSFVESVKSNINVIPSLHGNVLSFLGNENKYNYSKPLTYLHLPKTVNATVPLKGEHSNSIRQKRTINYIANAKNMFNTSYQLLKKNDYKTKYNFNNSINKLNITSTSEYLKSMDKLNDSRTRISNASIKFHINSSYVNTGLKISNNITQELINATNQNHTAISAPESSATVNFIIKENNSSLTNSKNVNKEKNSSSPDNIFSRIIDIEKRIARAKINAFKDVGNYTNISEKFHKPVNRSIIKYLVKSTSPQNNNKVPVQNNSAEGITNKFKEENVGNGRNRFKRNSYISEMQTMSEKKDGFEDDLLDNEENRYKLYLDEMLEIPHYLPENQIEENTDNSPNYEINNVLKNEVPVSSSYSSEEYDMKRLTLALENIKKNLDKAKNVSHSTTYYYTITLPTFLGLWLIISILCVLLRTGGWCCNLLKEEPKSHSSESLQDNANLQAIGDYGRNSQSKFQILA